jgi:hypothetical protein
MLSTLKVEKVVKAPIKPVPNSRGIIPPKCEPIMTPSRNDPSRFTAKVPQGSREGRRLAHNPNPYREIAPKKPPTATSTLSIMG